MGLTHSWQRDTELPPEAFSNAVRDCRDMLDFLQIPLAGPEGMGNPIFDTDSIMFNGQSLQACEPFIVHQLEFDRDGERVVRSYCKTQGQPYDLCVQVALIVLHHHLGTSFKVSSDVDENQWGVAQAACVSHLGYGAQFELSKD